MLLMNPEVVLTSNFPFAEALSAKSSQLPDVVNKKNFYHISLPINKGILW